MKRLRHNAILELIRSAEITSQEDLMRGLKARDIAVSQSTLSRDIQELRLAKAGGVYTVVEGEASTPHSEGSSERIIREFMIDIDVAQNIVVVKTYLQQLRYRLAAGGIDKVGSDFRQGC